MTAAAPSTSGSASTISADYRALQAKLHADNPDYGMASVHFAPLVAQVVRANKVRQVLDYGAGKGRLAESLPGHLKEPVTVTPYDPAIEAWSATPQPADMVACIDVLEHIEPDHLDAVLDDLKRVTQRIGIFTISTGPAVRVLPDGRNAHLIQQPASWWLPRLMARFELIAFNRMEQGFWVIVEPSHARPSASSNETAS
jgi:2-polyprenyl-3-methyl-5-hydroxy-6-metoxy-1,4-benzoquinol methylase